MRNITVFDKCLSWEAQCIQLRSDTLPADAGRNEFQLISGDKHYLIVRDLNVDADGKETELVGLLGAGGNVDPKHEEEFRNAVREKGIPEENIRNFIDHDAGHNEFQPISGDKDYLLVRHVNVDGDGKETELVGLFDAGHNEFRPVRVDNGALIAHVINVDEHGKETELV
ncbi:hypothetical protein R6Z07F_019654 [Ovis aries]